MEKTNLNEQRIINDEKTAEPLFDNSVVTNDVEVIFKNISEKLIKEIEKADVVIGCVAWLTCPKIIKALARKSGVSIIVQKEDFLRPDFGQGKNKWWKYELRKLYNSIPNNLNRFMIPGIVSSLSYCSDPTLEPIRCVGNYNSDKSPAFPRMHNKFVLFAKIETYIEEISGEKYVRKKVKPYAIWTGSFNFTKNAQMSLENAILIRNNEIVNAFFKEYNQICALSEPLDWESNWTTPEWRLGT